MRLAKIVFLIIFLGFAMIFSFQNSNLGVLSFLGWQLHLPLSIISLLSYMLGAISGGILFSMFGNRIGSVSRRKYYY